MVLLATALMIATGRFAYGSAPAVYDRVIVAPGDTVWSIAVTHYAGDPRAHVEAILQTNHLSTPLLRPGQALQLPRD
jgi:LysM repeat protein